MGATRLPGPGRREGLGLLRRLVSEPTPVLDELRSRFGPVVGLGAGPLRLAVVGDPAALRSLLDLPSDAYRWGHAFNVLGFVVGPGSLLVSDGEDHQRRRGSVQRAFTRRRLNAWIPLVLDRADAAVDGVLAGTPREGSVVDLQPIARQLVLDVIVRILLGERSAGRVAEIGARFERPQAYLESSGLRQLPHRLPFTRRARVRNDRRALDRIIDEEAADRRRHPSFDPTDVLEALVFDSELRPSELRDQIVTLIGAGYHSTAASLGWVLWRAVLHEGLWAALRAEADAVLGPLGTGERAAPARTTDATPSHLSLARCVVQETLRLHPAGVISPRQVVADLDVGEHRLRAGTLLLWSPYLAGRDEGSWPEPLRFDPHRFLDPTPEQAALQRDAWVPFGRGPRSCLGFALAQMELTLVLARLAQRLDLAAPRGAAVPAFHGMVVSRPAGGVPLHVTARHAAHDGARAAGG